MKKFIKMLAMALSLAMVITLFVPMTDPVQAATVKLNYSKKTIYEGDSLKLKVKGAKQKVKWSSSNKKIASVNSKGVVTGKNEGVATITAKVAKKSLKCKVTVREKSKVTYINNRSVEYNSDANVERLFFGFKDQYDHVVDGSGIVKIRIENSGEIVYEKTISFKQYDFGYWTNRLYGERYLCSIDIPISEIKEGKSDSGKIYYQVIEKNAEFSEYSLSIRNLPKAARKIDVDTTTYIPSQYTSKNKAQIVSYNINNSDKIFLTFKITQFGDKDWTSYSTKIYEYDKNGNVLDDHFIYDNDIYVGKTFVEEFYLEDETVRIGIDSSSNSSSNNNPSSDIKPTASVSENITQLKQYIHTNGKTNVNGEKYISYSSSGQTTSIVYSESTGNLKFVTSSGDSGVIMTMSSPSNSTSMQVEYVLSSGGVGILANAYVTPSSYSLDSSVRFSITKATGGLTDDDVQELCNSELRVGFTGWQIILYSELTMTLKDIGFVSYN